MSHERSVMKLVLGFASLGLGVAEQSRVGTHMK